MTDMNETNLSHTLPGQERYVAPLEETPLKDVDSVDESAPASSLWADAWRTLRKNPMFIHPGDVRGGQAVPGEQGIAYAAQQHLKGGAAGEAGAGQHVGLHPCVKSPPGQTPPPEGGGHAPDQGGGGVPLLLPVSGPHSFSQPAA